MSAARKALDALEAAGKAATPRPWDTGDGVCGPYLSFKGHPSGGGLDEPYDDGSEPLWLGGTVAESDRALIVAAVNLAAPLAAVARAAVEYRAARVAYRGASVVGPCPILTARDRLDAALDAFEAAALAQGFGKETT